MTRSMTVEVKNVLRPVFDGRTGSSLYLLLLLEGASTEHNVALALEVFRPSPSRKPGGVPLEYVTLRGMGIQLPLRIPGSQ